MDKELGSDLQILTGLYRDRLARRGGLTDLGVWREVAKNLRKNHKDVYARRGRNADPSLKGREGAKNISGFFNAHAQDSTKKQMQKIQADPFFALEVEFGKKAADLAYALAKKYYFEGLKKFAALDYNTTLREAKLYCLGRLNEKLPENTRKVLLAGQKKLDWFEPMRHDFTAEEKARELSYLEGREGKILQQDLHAAKISNRGTASHARGVAASETGPEAQKKAGIKRPRFDEKVNPRGKGPKEP